MHGVRPAQASTTERGYGGEWQRISRAYRAAHPTCEEPGCGRPSQVVDHLDGKGPLKNNRWSNLEALCSTHHNSRTLRWDGGYGNPRRQRPSGMKRCKSHAACLGTSSGVP